MKHKPRAFADLDPANLPLETLIMGMPYDAYAAIDAVRSTHLKAAAQSCAHYRQAVIEPRGDTPSMRLGRWAHQAVFEPHLFENVLAENLRLKSDQSAREHAVGIQAAIAANATATQIIEAGARFAESVVLWRDPETQLLCKVRHDVAGPCMSLPDTPEGFVLDLKTTQDCLPDAFSRSVLRFGYHIQLAHYLAGADACGLTEPGEGKFWALAVETHPPYAMRLYDMRPWRRYGEDWCRVALTNIKETQETGLYPAYSENETILAMPPWAPEAPLSMSLAEAMRPLQRSPESVEKG